MKSGAMLLNIMIGTLIASGVIVMLMTSLSQFISLDMVVTQDVNYLRRLIVAHRQIERDISGTFVPHQVLIKKKEEKSEGKEKAQKPPVQSTEQKEQKPLKDCFV